MSRRRARRSASPQASRRKRRAGGERRVLPGAVADALARGRSDLCSHGSLLYASPAAARADAAEIRKKDPTSRHLRPYECDDMPGRYHLGKIADVVVAGLTSADELYERTKERHARPR